MCQSKTSELARQDMNKKLRLPAIAIILMIAVWTITPWFVPSHYIVINIQLLKSRMPTYEVRLRNISPWPIILTEAHWYVTHASRYSFWAPSEAPKQDILLLPYQSHDFQFVIYNQCPTGHEYYNGSLKIELTAVIHVIGSTSQIDFTAGSNSTSNVPPTRVMSGLTGGNC